MIAELPVLRPLVPVLKFLYGYREDGAENMPASGPLIILYAEYSFLCDLYNALQTAALLSKKIARDRVLIFLAEELFALPYFHSRHLRSFLKVFPLQPQGTGKYSLNLLEALEHLKSGGIIVMNPEGDMSRDGRPLPAQGGAAWLGLHAAAPLVPIIATAGTYDAWPPWKLLPYARGQASVRIGKPFRLAETAREKIVEEDLKKGIAKIQSEMSALRFGSGGLESWAGSLAGRADVVNRPAAAKQDSPPKANTRPSSIPAWKQGIPLLLWRCPICRTEDSLFQKGTLFKVLSVGCRACGSVWTVNRRQRKDFRLKVSRGPDPLVGLDLPLSGWYDEMKRDFRPEPPAWVGLGKSSQEKTYLRTNRVKLLLDRSNSLLRDWSGREAPDREFPARAGDWRKLGPGRLTLTNLRLIWESPEGSLDFWWPRVKTLHLRFYHLWGLGYGVTPYRFVFLRESGLKWLTYAGELAKKRRAEAPTEGLPIKISHY